MKYSFKWFILVVILLVGVFYFFKAIQNQNLNNLGVTESGNVSSDSKKADETITKIKEIFSTQRIKDLIEEEKFYKEKGLDIFGLTPLNEQLNMLEKANDCRLDDDLKDKFVAKKFKLFYGKGGPVSVDLLFNNNLKKCAVRLIGSDGDDVSLDNFNYTLIYLNEENIYYFIKSFYKAHTFNFVDSKLKEIGYDFSESGSISCDNSCNRNTTNLFNYLSKNLLNDPIVTKVSKIYDEMFLNL